MKAVLRTVLALTLLLGCVPGLAYAHAYLDRSTPGDGETLERPPQQVKLWFTEPLVAKLSTAKLLDASGNPVAGTAPSSPADSVLALSLPPLAPGEYTVTYKVLSNDTHTTEGSLKFTVAGKGATPPGPATAPPPPAAQPPVAPTPAQSVAPTQAAGSTPEAKPPQTTSAVPAPTSPLAGAPVSAPQGTPSPEATAPAAKPAAPSVDSVPAASPGGPRTWAWAGGVFVVFAAGSGVLMALKRRNGRH